jgi:hypothetical protein
VSQNYLPDPNARVSLVTYLDRDGDYCVDVVLEGLNGMSDRAGLCSPKDYRRFNFTDRGMALGNKTFASVIGLVPGSLEQLHARMSDAPTGGELVRGLVSDPLPKFGGLVAWAVIVEGWMPSGGSPATIEGFDSGGKKVVSQLVCDCS